MREKFFLRALRRAPNKGRVPEWFNGTLSPRDKLGAPGVHPLAKIWEFNNMHYVYILLLKNKKLYTGYTTDLKERYKQHKLGKVKSTRYLRPLKLVHYEAYLIEEDARRREKFLKTSDGNLFLRRQSSVLFKKIGKHDGYKDNII